ncbi:hypothetical protein EcB7A_3639, partial [Escherichia coli B7A]
KEMMKVEIILPVIVSGYEYSYNVIYSNDDGYACELCGML